MDSFDAQDPGEWIPQRQPTAVPEDGFRMSGQCRTMQPISDCLHRTRLHGKTQADELFKAKVFRREPSRIL